MGFTYREAYNIPVWQRLWFMTRIKKEFQKSEDAGQEAQTKAAHQNTPTNRALQGKHRAHVPAKLRRFT
tara:strand:+ start:35721 stop:35927 length:207 start_codon:yes stop_codon:yes gene_type:complete